MQVKWMLGVLAAALWIAPVAAETGSTSSGSDRPSATGNGSDPTRHATETNTTSGAAGHADRTHGQDTSSAATSGTGSSSTAGSPGGSASTTASGGQTARTLAKLHDGNQAEVEAGSWMKDHAQNSKVKDFAQKMVDDHGSMDKDVMSFAQKKGIDLSSASTSAGGDKAKAEHQLDDLKAMKGGQADRAYMDMMVKDHQQDVSEARQAEQTARSGKDDELAKLLDKSAKKMEDHLKDAQKIQHDLSRRQARTPGQSQ